MCVCVCDTRTKAKWGGRFANRFPRNWSLACLGYSPRSCVHIDFPREFSYRGALSLSFCPLSWCELCCAVLYSVLYRLPNHRCLIYKRSRHSCECVLRFLLNDLLFSLALWKHSREFIFAREYYGFWNLKFFVNINKMWIWSWTKKIRIRSAGAKWTMSLNVVSSEGGGGGGICAA